MPNLQREATSCLYCCNCILNPFYAWHITYHSSNSDLIIIKNSKRLYLGALCCFSKVNPEIRINRSSSWIVQNILGVLHEGHRICIVKQITRILREGNSDKEGKPSGRLMVRSASSAYVKHAGIGWLPTTFSFWLKEIASEDFLDLGIGHARTLTPVGSVEIRSAYLRLTVTLLQEGKQMLVRVGVCKLTHNQNMRITRIALCVVTKITCQTFALSRHTDNETKWNIGPEKLLVRRTQRQVTYTQPDNEEICYISRTGERRLCYRLITFISSYQVK